MDVAFDRETSGRRARTLFGLVFLVALVIRLTHLWGQWDANPLFLAPNMDEAKHHEWAMRIAAGEGLGPRPFFRAPLYYAALAAFYRVAGPNILLARAMGCILGATTCLLIALLGRRLSGLSAGIVAGLLAAFYWPFVHFDQLLLSAGLETFLAVLLLLTLVTAGRRERWYLAAGAIWGLSVITRPTMLTVAPVIGLWIWFGGGPNGPTTRGASGWRRRIRTLALFIMAAVAAIAPVTLRNRLVGGEWVLVAANGGVNFFIGNNARADGVSAVVPGTRTDWDGGDEDTHAVAERDLRPRLGRPPTDGETSGY